MAKEDKYEYACMRTHKDGVPFEERLYWTDKQDAASDVKLMNGGSAFYTYKLVRRVKAGPVEIMEED
jgi:hypothetical protein